MYKNLTEAARAQTGATFADRMNALSKLYEGTPPNQLAYALYAVDKATHAEYNAVYTYGFKFTGADMPVGKRRAQGSVLTWYTSDHTACSMSANAFAGRSEHITLSSHERAAELDAMWHWQRDTYVTGF